MKRISIRCSSNTNSLTINTGAGVDGVSVINIDGDSLTGNYQNTSVSLNAEAGVTTTIINISGGGPRRRRGALWIPSGAL